MEGDNSVLPVCFLCLGTIPTKDKGTAVDLDLLPQKFLTFTENHLHIPSEEWVLDGVKLKNAICFECFGVIRALCNLYENLCDIRTKLADKMGQLSSLLKVSKERSSRRKEKALMEALERQLGVEESCGKVQEMRDLLSEKCKLYSKQTFPQKKNQQLSISRAELDGNDESDTEAGDNELNVKEENDSLVSGDDDDFRNDFNDLQSDPNDDLQSDSKADFENDSSNLDENNMDEGDQDYFPSSSSDDGDDDIDFDEDDHIEDDPDFSIQKETSKTSAKKSRSSDKPFSCELCDQKFSNKYSIPTHMKYIHNIISPKPEKPFSCNLCPNKFGTRVSLVSHISAKHRGHSILNKCFKCDICSRGYTTQNAVVLHKKKRHGMEPPRKTCPPKKFPCNFCPKSFGDSLSWGRHVNAKHKSSTSGVSFPCNRCSLKFDTFQQRLDHAKRDHKSNDDHQGVGPLTYKCTECSMTFDSQRQKVHHTYTVHKKANKTDGFMKRIEDAMKTDTSDLTQQSCVVCSQEFKSWKLLHSHLKQTHEKKAANNKSLMCYFCNCLFCYEQSVWAHLRTCVAHNFTKIEFPCDHVDHLGYDQWLFKTPTELESHFREEHNDCEVTKCGDCRWPFLDKNMLELHRLVHLPRIKYKYHCPGCSNTYLNTDTLQHHYNSVHGVSLKLYRCLKCKMGFAAKSAIKLHMSWCRGGGGEDENDKQQVLEFLCSECPKSYETAYQLKNHVRMIHTTAQCPDCGVVLPKSKISHHKIMKHAEEKFLCTLCGKAYKTRALLQTHMSAHGQYRWICKYCGSGSRSSGHLRRHIGRMHKDKLAEENAAKISTPAIT